jgi:hypothetical protein
MPLAQAGVTCRDRLCSIRPAEINKMLSPRDTKAPTGPRLVYHDAEH